MNSQNQNNLILSAMQEWFEAGAVIVPLLGEYIDDYSHLSDEEYDRWKRPLGSWKDDREKLFQQALTRYKSKKHLIGLIPASLGIVCIDVDEGDHDDVIALLDQHEIACTIAKTPGGAHLFVKDGGWPSGNMKWEFGSASGDIRYDKGYIVVWEILAIKRQLIISDTSLGAGEQIANLLKPKKQKGKKQKGMFKPPHPKHTQHLSLIHI